MIKKGVSLLMALALCLTLLPASTLAAEAQGQAGQEQTVLTQGNDGQTQAPGQDGAGEDDKTSDEAPDKAPDKAPDEEPDEAVSAVQALIDALPEAETISEDNAADVEVQLEAIDEAKVQLSDEAHLHCICGGSVSAGDHTSHSDVTYTAWNGTDGITYNNNTAYVYLTDNATINSNLVVDGTTLYLCLTVPPETQGKESVRGI